MKSITFKQTIMLAGASFLILIILGVVIAANVFASIPHSSTKMISACRDNTTGGLRVIDIQNSETCGGSETALKWGGEQTATVNISYDPNDPTLTENYDAAQSRNVTSAIRITTAPQDNGYCFDLPFVPVFGMDGSFYPANNGGSVDSLCGGSGYEAYVPLGVRSWFFSE